MGTVTLTASGAVVGISPFAAPTVVGSAPQWGDASDSSYAVCDSTGGSASRGTASLDTLVLPSGATVTGIRARARMSCSGGSSAQLTLASSASFSGFVCYFTNDSDLTDNGTNGIGSDPADFDLVVATGAEMEGDPLTTLLAGAYVSAGTSGVETLTVYEFTVFVDYDGGEVALPCDTDVALDLSTAQFTEVDSMPFGQYGDGVIYGYIRSPATTPSYPDFFFALEALDPAKPYAVTVTFDPSSAHDSGGRSFTLTGVQPGSETDFNTVDGFPIGDLYDGSSNTDDSVTVRIGPGIGGWDDATWGVAAGFSRLFFETDRDGAVSAITIRKVCTSFAPPLRLTNRDDMFASARRLTGSSSRQASNRLTGYL